MIYPRQWSATAQPGLEPASVHSSGWRIQRGTGMATLSFSLLASKAQAPSLALRVTVFAKAPHNTTRGETKVR